MLFSSTIVILAKLVAAILAKNVVHETISFFSMQTKGTEPKKLGYLAQHQLFEQVSSFA